MKKIKNIPMNQKKIPKAESETNIHLDPSFYQMSELEKSPGLL
jgi:hypothetical protein